MLTLVGYYWPSLSLVYLFKPLATLFLILIALLRWIRSRSAYSLWIAIGLAFSLVGDILLIRPNQFFLPGLLAFLLAHVAYLIAFTRDCKFPPRALIFLAYLIASAGFYVVLFPTLPLGLRIPVAVYAALLSTMASQAMGRFLLLRIEPARWAAFGALFFMASDLLLACHHFRRPLLYSAVLILVPYYTGQCLIAWSTSSLHAAARSR